MSTQDNNIINIISNNSYNSKKTYEVLLKKLREKGFHVSKQYSQNAELNICIGGDGAFLKTVHNYDFPQIPFIGINTGHLGFFQEISPQNLDIFIEKYINKKYHIQQIFLVEAEIQTKTKNTKIIGINEIVIRGTFPKAIHLEIYINNNKLEKFSGDGIIIATPLGSTAYNFSSGGSVVHPCLKTLQLTPLSPIISKAYTSLRNSVIIPGDMIIKVQPEFNYKNPISIISDGIEYRFKDILSINLKISNKTISKITFDWNMYWDNLKDKLL